ncbi:MAG: hypothetical protein IKX00_04165 [Bacilli bacterium]|nr:hypothetical protein [Bacilli bacterium]
MSLFKKKEKEPRIIKDDDSLFIKLWYNKRSHAAIVLGLYLLFFLVLIVFMNLSSTGKKPDLTISGSTLNNKFLNFENKKLAYNYVIDIGSNKYYFSGTDKNDSIYGKILHNGESQTIMINNNECYVGDYNSKEEFVKTDLLCPEIIDYSYFNYKNIYDLIKDAKGYNYEEKKYYSFDLDNGINIAIYYIENEIKSIIINEKNNTYSFEYVIDDYSKIDKIIEEES